MLSTTDTDSPKTPDFKTILLTRHAQNETVCVSAYKVVNGKFVVSERFCNGVDEVANLIERSYQREDIGAIWTNIQRLKPGSSRRKKGETIDAYTNMTIDIDRRDKRDADGNKVNATDGEREALRTAAEKIAKFLSPSFGPCVFADSGNGFHLNWKLADIETGEGQRYYRAVLALLKRQFESPEANIEIDASLADDTQVVTVWGTWNRKYPELLDRPQRQSKVLFFPPTQKPIQFYDLEIFLNENKDDSAALASTKPEEKSPRKKIADQKPDPEWLENHGVPHLVEFWAPHIAHEEDSYDRGGDTHHPIAPCPCHGGEDFHHHSHARDCEIIEFADGGIGISCFSGELSLGQVIAKMNAVKGENYPHRVFAEESDEEIARAFGVEDAHAVPTPVGEVCYRENCACGNVHVQRPKPQELFEEGEYELWREGETGITGIRLSDVKERPVEWLWTNRLPAGCGLVVSGAPGTNKSMLSLSLVACVPTGTDWPDGEKNEMGPREVLIAATEDNLETTIKPRLMAMGADMNKITSIKNVFDVGNDGKRKSRDLNLDGDAAKLYRMLKARPDILMVVLDPLTGFFGDVDGKADRRSFRAPDSREQARRCQRGGQDSRRGCRGAGGEGGYQDQQRPEAKTGRQDHGQHQGQSEPGQRRYEVRCEEHERHGLGRQDAGGHRVHRMGREARHERRRRDGRGAGGEESRGGRHQAWAGGQDFGRGTHWGEALAARRSPAAGRGGDKRRHQAPGEGEGGCREQQVRAVVLVDWGDGRA
jgi:hypothetical protein